MNRKAGEDVDLEVLRVQHAMLSQEIHLLSQHPAANYLGLNVLKQQRLKLKDKIVARGGATKKSK